MNELDIVILAAGKGNRMNSDIPKFLYKVGGETSLQRILKNVAWGTKDPIVVISRDNEKIIKETWPGVTYAIQEKQLGTGDAVRSVKEGLKDRSFAENIMVLPVDHPLMSEKMLQNFWNVHKSNNAVITIVTVVTPDFLGDHEPFSRDGRILRDKDNNIQGIVEYKDASDEERNIKEVNTAICCFKTKWLWDNINALKNENKSGEFYLTDMVQIAASQNIPIYSYIAPDFKEGTGFNTQEQLEILQKFAGDK